MGLEGLIAAAPGLTTPRIEIDCAHDVTAAVGDPLALGYGVL